MLTQYQSGIQYERMAPVGEATLRISNFARPAHNTNRTENGTRRTWPDWVNVALGVVLALTPLVVTGAPVGWFVILGLIAVVTGLWALSATSPKALEWTQIVVGAVVFLSPWLGGFAVATGAAWTAWVIGAALIVFATVGMNQGSKQTL